MNDPIWMPVYQEDGDGQCFRACIATMLCCRLVEVPPAPPTDDADPAPYWNKLRAWLWKEWSLDLVIIYRRRILSGAPIIVGGKSPRFDPAGHAVIMQAGELLHDPHPSGSGLDGEPEEYYLLVPMAPWRDIYPAGAFEL